MKGNVLPAVLYTLGGLLALDGFAQLIARDWGHAVYPLAVGSIAIFGGARRQREKAKPAASNPDEEKGLLTVEQVAERLDTRPDWVLHLVARKMIPYVKLRPGWQVKNLRFRETEIDEWVREDESRMK